MSEERGECRLWDRENEIRAQNIEMRAAKVAYECGLGAGEWEAFLTTDERGELSVLAHAGYGTWGRERYVPGEGPIDDTGPAARAAREGGE